MGHVRNIFHLVGVVCATELNQDIPGGAESFVPQCPPKHGFYFLQSIRLAILERVPVCIAFILPIARHRHRSNSLEQLLVRDVFELSVL